MKIELLENVKTSVGPFGAEDRISSVSDGGQLPDNEAEAYVKAGVAKDMSGGMETGIRQTNQNTVIEVKRAELTTKAQEAN